MKLLTIAITLLFSLPSLGQTVVGVDLVSVHFPSRSYINNFNPGLYVRLDNGVTAGGYYNSLERMSYYVGYTVEWKMLALTMGAVTGYQKKPGQRGFNGGYFAPLFAPSVRVPLEFMGVSPRVSFIPGVAGSYNVFHLSLEKEL